MLAKPLLVIAVLLALVGCASATAAEVTPGDSPLGPDDGYVADGESVRLIDDLPAITGLAAPLREALSLANEAATVDGVEITLTSGWRSERYQQYLFDEAVAMYGSEAEASRWAKLPGESKHVTGEAIDVATADAMDWLNRFGGTYGLCQTYANEAWHFELVADASGACPLMLLDSSYG